MRWFQGFQTRRSGETAKMRLKLLLVSDKAGCSPEMILMIKDDVIHAISKYMELEKDKVQIQMDTEGSPKKGGCRTETDKATHEELKTQLEKLTALLP